MCDTYEAVLSKPWELADKILQSLRNDSLGGGKKRRKKARPREKRVEKVSELEQNHSVQHASAETTAMDAVENIFGENLPLQNKAIKNAQPRQSQHSSIGISVKDEHTGQENGDQGPPSGEPTQVATNTMIPHECGNHTNVTRESSLKQYTVSLTLSTDNEDAPRVKMLDDAQYPMILKGDSPSRCADLHPEFGSSISPPPGNQQAILNIDHSSLELKRASQDSDQWQHNAVGAHIVNKGSPSEWDTLDIGGSVPGQDGSKTLYNNEWLRRRNAIASTESEPGYKTPSIPLDTTKIVDKGSPSEWDALDIGASITEHGTSKFLYEADWLEVRNGNFNINGDYVRVSPSTWSDRKESHSDTSKVQSSAPCHIEAPPKSFSWEEEWERVGL